MPRSERPPLRSRPLLRGLLLATGILPLAACASGPRPAAEYAVWQAPSAGIETRELRLLAAEFWEGWTDWHPIEAADLGDPDATGRWPAVSAHVRGQREEQVWEMRTKLGLLDPAHYTPTERLTYELLKESLLREDLILRAGLDRWMIDPIDGPHVRMLTVAREQSAATDYERDQLVDRLVAFARAIGALRLSAVEKASTGFVAPRGAIDRTIEQLDALLATGVLDSPFLAPACGGGRWVDLGRGESLAAVAEAQLGDPLRNSELLELNRHLADPATRAGGSRVLLPSPTDALSPSERGGYVEAVRTVLEDEVHPALAAWRDALVFELAPLAPSNEKPGLTTLPGGSALYLDLIRIHTSLALDPLELTRDLQVALAETERELYSAAVAAVGTEDPVALRAILRGDKRYYFDSPGAVESGLRDHLRRAQTALRAWFLDLPTRPLVIDQASPLEPTDVETIAYRPAPAGASRPGRLVVEAGADRQSTFSAAAATYGAGLPGEHLLRELASEREQLALFRRYAGPSVMAAGWADYAEGLADEMGLYTTDLDRVGALSRSALRRTRAVADIGLHVAGWSRDQALAFFRDHSLLSVAEIDLEIDLLLARPAQALSPVVGGDKLRALRQRAQDSLGDDFNPRRFHHEVTRHGLLDLRSLERVVDAWIANGSADAALERSVETPVEG